MKPFMKHLSIALLVAGAAYGCTSNSASYEKPPIAVVNGVPIPGEFLDVIIAGQRAQGAPEDPGVKENIRKDLIRRSLLEQAANKAEIAKRPETRARQELARQDVLIRDYVQDWIKSNTPPDDELKQEYDTIKTNMSAQKEYRARHILLKTEQEARNVIARLDKGAKFVELTNRSLDPGTSSNGGDLGWANPSMLVPPFSEAMIKLDKGQYTKEPVKTDFGYHVILLEDVRSVQPPAFDDVKSELQQRVQQKKWQEYVDQLEKGADVK